MKAYRGTAGVLNLGRADHYLGFRSGQAEESSGFWNRKLRRTLKTKEPTRVVGPNTLSSFNLWPGVQPVTGS